MGDVPVGAALQGCYSQGWGATARQHPAGAGIGDALASDLLKHSHKSQRVSPQPRLTPADFTRHTIVLPCASETIIESLG